MPHLGPSLPQSVTPRITHGKTEKKAAPQAFKFASAVDLPSAEEIERREKNQLVVTGAVLGPDGKGIASVIVHLIDRKGNRIGQSCRSMADTGEFKVLSNESGKYVLSGYKRGYVMESSEPLALPIESGRIEGYNLRMIPEGCVVHGKVLTESGVPGPEDLTVKCLSKSEPGFARSARTDSKGVFRIYGVPVNSKCFVEVHATDGNLLARSVHFETVQKKEIYQEVKISPESSLIQDPEKPGIQGPSDLLEVAEATGQNDRTAPHAASSLE